MSLLVLRGRSVSDPRSIAKIQIVSDSVTHRLLVISAKVNSDSMVSNMSLDLQ